MADRVLERRFCPSRAIADGGAAGPGCRQPVASQSRFARPADIFSCGMDTLAERLDQQGCSARVYSTNGWQAVAHRIADRYSRGHKNIIVIIGHSLGANATFDIADELDRQNIPIELVVTFDATRP